MWIPWRQHIQQICQILLLSKKRRSQLATQEIDAESDTDDSDFEQDSDAATITDSDSDDDEDAVVCVQLL